MVVMTGALIRVLVMVIMVHPLMMVDNDATLDPELMIGAAIQLNALELMLIMVHDTQYYHCRVNGDHLLLMLLMDAYDDSHYWHRLGMVIMVHSFVALMVLLMVSTHVGVAVHVMNYHAMMVLHLL